MLDAVIAETPHLGSFGQLCAIEVFNAFDDPRPADVLIALLESDNAVVREWSAEALARLPVQRAVPALLAAHEAFRRRGEDPSYSEGERLRWALTDLGARVPVLPPRATELSLDPAAPDPEWRTAHLAEVVEELAAHHQAVLYLTFWRVGPDGRRRSWVSGPGLSWEVDRRLPWAQTVADCRDYALLIAAEAPDSPDVVAAVC
ncbi:HEAT repeat domain-containing protein [Kitasatospora sp. NPDC051914]|uniref:HEAT repeat domain-containing protein n=1 Tax=Kitasatospora sp. NPDC051914 TaxID=3154945 RepID=UPI0034142018